jgi:predicted dehydrogenase
LVRAGRIGELRSITGNFTYFNRDATNIRNVSEYGGGALLDIGCYPVTLSRFLYGEEPARAFGLLESDPEFKIDRTVSALLDFPSGQCSFVCSMQLSYGQRMDLLGTGGRMEIELPFTPPADQPTRITINDGSGSATGVITEIIAPCDQFTTQCDAFSRAIREGTAVPVSVEDAICNLAVIEAIRRSAESGKWETP